MRKHLCGTFKGCPFSLFAKLLPNNINTHTPESSDFNRLHVKLTRRPSQRCNFDEQTRNQQVSLWILLGRMLAIYHLKVVPRFIIFVIDTHKNTYVKGFECKQSAQPLKIRTKISQTIQKSVLQIALSKYE